MIPRKIPVASINPFSAKGFVPLVKFLSQNGSQTGLGIPKWSFRNPCSAGGYEKSRHCKQVMWSIDKWITLCQGVHYPQRSHRSPQLVSWCFETSKPQRIISELKTNFNLFPTVIHSTSHYTTSLFSQTTTLRQIFHKKPTQHTPYLTEPINLSRKDKIIPISSECKPRKTKHVLEPIYIPRACHHRPPGKKHNIYRKTERRKVNNFFLIPGSPYALWTTVKGKYHTRDHAGVIKAVVLELNHASMPSLFSLYWKGVEPMRVKQNRKQSPKPSAQKKKKKKERKKEDQICCFLRCLTQNYCNVCSLQKVKIAKNLHIFCRVLLKSILLI